MLLFLLDVALLVVAGFEAVRTLECRTRPALGLVMVAILASAVPFYLGAGDGAILRFAAAALAASIGSRERGWSMDTLAEGYPESKSRARMTPILVGLLAGLVVVGHPAYLALGVGLILLLQGWVRRAVAGVAMIVGLLTTTLLTTLLPAPIGGGWMAALGTVQSGVDAAALWASLEFSLGRSFGVIPYFLPLLLLLALHKFRGLGSSVVWASLVSCLVLCCFWPFDWLANTSLPGNGWFLPLYGALLIVPARSAPRWSLVLVSLVAMAILLPQWWGRLPGLEAPDLRRPTQVTRLLPVETLPRSAVNMLLTAGPMEVWSPDMEPDRGAWKVPGGEWGSLVISSRVAISQIWLDCGGQAGTDIAVRGGVAGDSLFRGDGGVGFSIDLGSGRRHRVGWSGDPVQVYVLHFRFPRALQAPIRVRVLDKI